MSMVIHQTKSKALQVAIPAVFFNEGKVSQAILFILENLLAIVAPDTDLKVGMRRKLGSRGSWRHVGLTSGTVLL